MLLPKIEGEGWVGRGNPFASRIPESNRTKAKNFLFQNRFIKDEEIMKV